MHVFIVHAHPEPESFNGALTLHAVEAIRAAGHTAEVSDLYRLSFNPVSDRRNFTTVANADYFAQQKEELYAHEHRGFAGDIEAELEKVRWADLLIFQFPLWWFGLPAILKGWVDKVFAMGPAYGYGQMYETGIFKGKRAMLALTTGGPEAMYTEQGHGRMKQILHPVEHGMLAFTGFTVLPAFVSFGVSRLSDDARRALLTRYGQHVAASLTTA